MTAPLLEVDDLVKHFPAGGGRVVRAVNGVSFRLEPGETLALVGESGSGKTTIGRCVLGLLGITTGHVAFRGNPVLGRASIRQPWFLGKLQIVFQEPAEALDPRLRIGTSIEEPLRALGVADRARRVEAAARRAGLSAATLEARPAELSAGTLQRASIARAIVSEPALIVLDEPTSALDPTARAEVVDLLRELQRELGTAYLFISHDLSTVHTLSHRIAVLYLGAMVEQGDAAEVFARPAHPYSLGLLQSVLLPMPGRQSGTAVSLQGEIPSPIDLPPGCFLASRCPFAEARCRAERPLPMMVEGRELACFRHEHVRAATTVTDRFTAFQRHAERLLGGAPTTTEQPAA
jgi:oligopeptide/dipeptide ABC transporter ATP-binding protein